MHETHELDWDVRFSSLNKLHYSSMLSTSSLISSLVVHPFIVMTVRQQVGVSTNKGSLLSTYKELGFKGLYRGCLPLALMGIPSSIVYFLAYEASREILAQEIHSIAPNIRASTFDFIQAISSSVLCNSFSLLLYVPGEIISSRMIVQHKNGVGMTKMIETVKAERGLSGLYRGYSSSLLTAVVSSATWWYAYNTCRRYMHVYFTKERPYFLDAAAGFTAGFSSVCVAHPFDTLKTRIMTGVSRDASMAVSFLRLIKKSEVRHLWKGFLPNLYQTSLTSTGFAMMYEMIKRVASDDAQSRR